MIKIRQFNELCNTLVMVSGAQGYCLIAQDGHAVNKLADKAGLQLACVMPQKGFDGSKDSYIQKNTFIIYCLIKDDDGQTDDQELDQYERAEEGILKIFDYLCEGDNRNNCPPFPNIDVHNIMIDPEWREFGGWNGWSITVTI
jgi:hypothetical protein